MVEDAKELRSAPDWDEGSNIRGDRSKVGPLAVEVVGGLELVPVSPEQVTVIVAARVAVAAKRVVSKKNRTTHAKAFTNLIISRRISALFNFSLDHLHFVRTCKKSPTVLKPEHESSPLVPDRFHSSPARVVVGNQDRASVMARG
jgi:hypothetical protein